MTEFAVAVRAGVLAGERSRASELATSQGVVTKVYIDIDGTPMLQRVLDTVADVVAAPTALCGPEPDQLSAAPWLQQRIADTAVHWVAPAPSPSASARAVIAGARKDDAAAAVLLTTGDHPLLSAATLASFIHDALATQADVVVGLAPIDVVRSSYPHSKRTVLKFADGHWCGCNLFFFRTVHADRLLDFWGRIEQFRKQPHRMLGALGPTLVARYLSGRLPITDALAALSKKAGVQVRHVNVMDGDAAVDVDSLADLDTVRTRFAARRVDGAAVGAQNAVGEDADCGDGDDAGASN